jgi:AraC family transcriptional regulator
MKVEVEVLGAVREPYRQVQRAHELGMMLRPGSIEVGLERFKMRRVKFRAGEMGLFPRHLERWIGSADQERLVLSISDAALMATSDGISGEVELRPQCKLLDRRVSGLIAAVNAERIADFPNGRLFLDCVEQALAVALVNDYAVRHRSRRVHRGGLGPARLRTIKELVHAQMEDELTLCEMAQSVELSPAHFSRMFRKGGIGNLLNRCSASFAIAVVS